MRSWEDNMKVSELIDRELDCWRKEKFEEMFLVGDKEEIEKNFNVWLD